MSKSNVSHLLRAFIPFSIMVLLQRVLLLVFGYMNLSERLAELLAFIPAAAVCAIIFSFVKTKGNGGGEYGVPPLTKKRKLYAVLMTVVISAVMIAIMYAVTSILDGTITDDVALTPVSILSLVIVHPIFEEYVFRGLIYKEMRNMNPVFATLASAVMFAIVHNSVGGMLYALASGIALAVLLETTGRLSVAIAAHMIVNSRSIIYRTLLLGMDDVIKTVDTVIFVLGALSLICVIVIVGHGRDTDSKLEAEIQCEAECEPEVEDDAT